MLQYNVDLSDKTILVTGVAGFIGSNLCQRLLTDYPSLKVIGIDNVTDYYDVRLKTSRLERLANFSSRFVFYRESIADKVIIDKIFADHHPHVVVNLAAQAGGKHSASTAAIAAISSLVAYFITISSSP